MRCILSCLLCFLLRSYARMSNAASAFDLQSVSVVCARLTINLHQVEAQPLPEGPSNPFCNAFVMQETELLSTSQAQRDVNFATARCWTIKNPGVLNPVSGEPVAFRLLPGPSESCEQ